MPETPTTAEQEISRLKRRLERERAARKAAEQLLEDKASQLFDINQQLRELVHEQEQRVAARTQELNLALHAAEAANTHKSAFLANVSHEIRTPMNAIIGLTYLVQDSDLSRQQRDYINKINVSAQNLLGLINSILDFSKIESGVMQLEELEFSLDEILENIYTVTHLKAREKGLHLLIKRDFSLADRYIGDALKLKQVLTNLVTNAVKFTDQGCVGMRVMRSEHNTAQAGLRLRFEVEDTGIGISPAQLNKLFRPFTQADESTTRQYGGTGLGLSISKQLVELMGGQITVNSQPGQGSLFSIELPLQATETADIAPQDWLKGKRIWLENGSCSLADFLRTAGACVQHNPRAAEPAYAASPQAVQAFAPDLVLIFLDSQQALQNCPFLEPDKDFYDALHTLPVLLLNNSPVRLGSLQQSLISTITDVGTPQVILKKMRGLLGAEGRINNMSALNSLNTEYKQQLSGLAHRRLLLAEDNPINTEVVQALLERLGLQVDCVTNGREAISALRAKSYDLVLMDVQMPEMDGLSATRLIRQEPEWQALPIVALTANAGQDDIARTQAAGMNGHLSKPIDPPALIEALCQWLEADLPAQHAPDATAPAGSGPLEALLGRHVQVKAGLARVNGDQNLYLSLLQRFVERRTALLAELSEASDTERQACLHSLKGAAATLGAMPLAGLVAALEGVTDPAEVRQQLLLIDRQLQGIEQDLEQLAQTTEILDTPGYSPQALITRLRPLLAAGDIAVLDWAGAVQSLAGQDPRWFNLAQLIESFDFSAAEQLLSELAGEQDI